MTPREPELLDVRDGFVRGGLLLLGAAAAAVVVVVAGFDWDLRRTLGIGALAAVGWGVAGYVWEVRPRVPAGELTPPPPGLAHNSPPGPWQLVLALLGGAIVPAALAGLDDLGAIFVPGVALGGALASLVGAVQVTAWERRHGRRVVELELPGGDVDLYAVPRRRRWR